MANDPIKHVVVLLLENRSFDQILGCFSEVYDNLDGIDRLHPRTNSLPTASTSGRQEVFEQRPTTLRQMPWRKPYLWDPHHEVSHVHTQMEGPVGRPGRMGGFIADFVEDYPDSTDEARQYVMDYFPLDFLPALHRLGRDFTICDRWFSSLPGRPGRTASSLFRAPRAGASICPVMAHTTSTSRATFIKRNPRSSIGSMKKGYIGNPISMTSRKAGCSAGHDCPITWRGTFTSTSSSKTRAEMRTNFRSFVTSSRIFWDFSKTTTIRRTM